MLSLIEILKQYANRMSLRGTRRSFCATVMKPRRIVTVSPVERPDIGWIRTLKTLKAIFLVVKSLNSSSSWSPAGAFGSVVTQEETGAFFPRISTEHYRAERLDD